MAANPKSCCHRAEERTVVIVGPAAMIVELGVRL